MGILDILDEKLLRDIGDSTLSIDIAAMNRKLRTLTDDYICNMQDNQTKRVVSILNLYANLVHVLHYTKPNLVADVSLRMVQLTLSKGITPVAPKAFAVYGEVLASMGNISEGCRLGKFVVGHVSCLFYLKVIFYYNLTLLTQSMIVSGKLALKLVEKEASLKYKPMVIAVVQQFILWYTEPLQAIAETYHEGYKLGQQLGDTTFTVYNLSFLNQTNYLTGQNLSIVQTNAKDRVQNLLSRKQMGFVRVGVLLHYHAIALREGLHILDAGRVDDIPTIAEIDIASNIQSLSESKIYQLMRAFLFRQFSDDSFDIMNLSDSIEAKKMQLRPILAFGIFYEDLMCFLRSIAANDPASKATWVSKGQSILTRIRCWREHSSWNWENKVLLLEAMEMHTLGNFDAAGPLYTSSIRSAHEHKFIHEEAIASELTGDFFYEQGHHVEAYPFYMHSIKLLNKWDALAVAMRVQSSLESKFGSDNVTDLSKTVNVDETMKRILGNAVEEPTTNKRQVIE